MATQCRGKIKINKHKLVVIQAYAIIVILVLIGATVGFLTGRFTAPKKIETITETEVKDITYFDVPLSHSLQRYIYEVCVDENVPVTLAMAMIERESDFDQDAIGSTDDYGLMQINKINHEMLKEEYRAADMLNPYQNVFCGIKIIGSYIEKYEGDYGKALMAYNMGDYGARKAWDNGITSTSYSKAILELMSDYEKEVKDHAENADNE